MKLELCDPFLQKVQLPYCSRPWPLQHMMITWLSLHWLHASFVIDGLRDRDFRQRLYSYCFYYILLRCSPESIAFFVYSLHSLSWLQYQCSMLLHIYWICLSLVSVDFRSIQISSVFVRRAITWTLLVAVSPNSSNLPDISSDRIQSHSMWSFSFQQFKQTRVIIMLLI